MINKGLFHIFLYAIVILKPKMLPEVTEADFISFSAMGTGTRSSSREQLHSICQASLISWLKKCMARL